MISRDNTVARALLQTCNEDEDSINSLESALIPGCMGKMFETADHVSGGAAITSLCILSLDL